MSNCRIMWVHALTPVHVGCGFGVGAVDLPITRERVTNWPVLPGSGIKGVLADHHDAAKPDRRDGLKAAAFGRPDTRDEEGRLTNSNSGALVVGDARLVALPVRSLYGTFAWITCPLALRRLLRDLKEAGLDTGLSTMSTPGENEMHTTTQAKDKLCDTGQTTAYLADLDVTAVVPPNGWAAGWAEKLAGWLFPQANDPWRAMFQARFGIVHENLFNYLLETGTEIVTRIHVDPDTGTVKKGQLWTEEALPAESIAASLVWVDRLRSPGGSFSPQNVIDTYCKGEAQLQMGGKATVGRGRVRAVFSGQ